MERRCLSSDGFYLPDLRALVLVGILLLFLTGITEPADAAGQGAQESWHKTFPGCGTCEGRAITPVPDGGYIVTGAGSDAAGYEVPVILKTDSTGTLQWQVTAGEPSCTGTALAPGPSSGTAILASCPSGHGDAILMLIENEDGRVRTSRSYEVDRRTAATAMTSVPAGGFLIAEEADTIVIGKSGREMVFRRLDTEGNPLWDRTYPDTFTTAPVAVLARPAGDFITAGSVTGGGSRGTDILLLGLDSQGTETGRQVYGTDGDEVPAGIVAARDGGYLVAGSSCRGGQAGTCEIYVVRAGAGGSKLWDRHYGGTGRDNAAAVVRTQDGGYTIIGMTRTPDPAVQDRDILILHIDDQGTELWRRTVGTVSDESVGGAVLAAGGSLVITGSSADPKGKRTLFLTNIGNGGMTPPAGLQKLTSPQQGTGSLLVAVRDAESGGTISGAQIYSDGKRAGSTSAVEGTFSLPGQPAVPHSVRVTKEGYRENTIMVTSESGPDLIVSLQPSPVHRLLGAGAPEQSLDIVFVPSNMSYDCTLQQKVVAYRYTGNKELFVDDIRRITGETLLRIPSFSADPARIPDSYTGKLNIYYYWDGSNYADAFDGCAGRLPEGFWDEVPFADVAVILYPSYGGRYTGSPCEPQGCTNGYGPGLQSWMKVPADRSMLFLHESGHALFGLMDTYCGENYYAEITPYPNLWTSGQNCTAYASQNNGNNSLCRLLDDGTVQHTGQCQKGFWKYDPDPDLMGGTAVTAKFGMAATQRIRYILDAMGRT